MTKLELAAVAAARLKHPVSSIKNAVDELFAAIAGALMKGDKVEIRGFGIFTVRHYRAHDARNPKAGTVVHLKESKRPHFKAGKELRKRLEHKPRVGEDPTKGEKLAGLG
jgi:integration host factor subunit beta